MVLTIWLDSDTILPVIYIKRELTHKIKQLSAKFGAVTVIGPRQSGKTTLVKEIFPKYKYVSLEDLDNRSFADSDPRGFMRAYSSQVIIDEVQKSPGLFSYLQTHLDSLNKAGQYILTGSQNFFLLEEISQSLAGRVGIVKLLPLSISELQRANYSLDNFGKYVFNGFYPAVYAKKISPNDWYSGYVQTYIERDVRSILNVPNLSVFQKFLQLCAGRVGQIVNLSSLGSDVGITHNTARSWLSILEASFVTYTLKPYFRNFNKRIVKSPKLYFYDSGLVCYLLNITSFEQITSHYLKGALFENLVAGELVKKFFNQGREASLYFWRDKTGREVDFILEKAFSKTLAIEVKAGETFAPDQTAGLDYWRKIAGQKGKGYVIYGGDKNQKRGEVDLVSWRNLDLLKTE